MHSRAYLGYSNTVKKIRFFLALWIAKAAALTLKLTKHNGTQLPGVLAIRVCPDFLAHIAKPERIIGVTGTNGKTTVANLIVDALEKLKISTVNNRLGSNLHHGVASSLINGVTLMNHARHETGVFELDERATPRIFPYMKPELLVVTNLFRDSVQRNAHSEYIFWVLDQGLSPATRLLLNADDVVCAQLGEKAGCERVYFGIDHLTGDDEPRSDIVNDGRVCPKCHYQLTYTARRYHHIGRAYCKHCAWHSPDPDYLGSDVDIPAKTMGVQERKSDTSEIAATLTLVNDGIHNIYNIVTAYGALREYGVRPEDAERVLKEIHLSRSRYSQKKVGQVYVGNQMAKDVNAVGNSRAFEYLAGKKEPQELILMMGDIRDVSDFSENPCWIYDSDFEYLNAPQIKHVVVTGKRARDYRLRLLLAGVPEEKISLVERELDAPKHLHYTPGESIFVCHGVDSVPLGMQVMRKVEEIAAERAEKD